MYARTVFYKINTTEPLNPEAAVLYEKDVQLFKSKVVESVKLCNSHLFDQPKIDDPYAIRFVPVSDILLLTTGKHTLKGFVCEFLKKKQELQSYFLSPFSIGFSFSPWNPAVHEEAKERMFTFKRRPEEHHKGTQVSGLSWVKPGSTQPFSKEDSPPQS
ncbi:hypothetical protein GOODEAATRI_028228 [Goodea atripinnis]|uniref:Uncharacterized protein n=1 Tax=Goodea atripinnis TaxID=208336 RepID=A0ABV0MLD4_9TELE